MSCSALYYQLVRYGVTAVVASLGLSACGDPSGPELLLGTPLRAIQVHSVGSPEGIVEVGDTTRLSAFGRVGGILGLLLVDRVLDGAWRTSDAAVARVERLSSPPPSDSTTKAQALVYGVRPGVVQVTVSARGVAGAMDVRVIPAIARLDLTPRRLSIEMGDTVDVVAEPRDAADVAIARVPFRFDVDSGLGDAGGGLDSIRVVAVDTGRFTVTAGFRRATASVSLRVTRRSTPNVR